MQSIQVETTINSSIEKVWNYWTLPEIITKWNQESTSWNCPKVEKDFVVGGRIIFTMAAKDGTTAHNFQGCYTKIVPHESIEFTTEDRQHVLVKFQKLDDLTTRIVKVIESDDIQSLEQQKIGWQALLDGFKSYTEAN